MKIAFFQCEEWEQAIVTANFPNDELVFLPGALTDATLPPQRDYDAVCIFVGSRITAATIAAFPNLKLVTTRSTGFDHIDLDACKARGIAVSYVPGYGDNTVAEFAFGLLLNLTRKIYQGINQVKEKGSFSLEGLRGIDIKGKTIGIIGTGRIGREAIGIAKGFGMNVLAYDVFPNAAAAATMGFKYVSLEELLGSADAISLHCPLTKETEHILNKTTMPQIKKGAYLVNTARGGLVETAALIDALKSGTLAGAAIDVFEEENETMNEFGFMRSDAATRDALTMILENDILMKMPNVLMTPHNAFNSNEALGRILQTTMDNINGFAAGKPVNLVP
jgi:D-lactate dehydrogenase